jgi:hypothetical protein
MIRTVWLNGMAVGTVQRLGYESGMQGQYSYLVAGWLDPDRQGATAPSYSYARSMVLSRARVLLRDMERKAAETAKAEFPPTTSDMAYIEDGVVHDVETWNN